MMENQPESQPDSRLSNHEEYIWMQQQSPDSSLSELRAWKLGDKVELSRLLQALQTLTQHYPELDARYRFRDDGELVKTYAASTSPRVDLRQAHTTSDMARQLVEWQEVHWDLERVPPFKAAIIHCNEDVILALAAHKILAESWCVSRILQAVSGLYLDEPLASARHVLPAERVPALPSSVAPIQWSRNASGHAIQSLQVPLVPLGRARYLALKYKVSLSTHEIPLAPIASEGLDITTLQVIIATHFARFIAETGQHETIGLSLITPGGTHRLTLRPSDGDVLAHRTIMETIKGHAPSISEPDDALPWIEINLTGGLTSPDGIIDQELLIPTREAHTDFTLAIMPDHGSSIDLVLTTGQAVSSHAGVFLLDRFLCRLASGEPSVSGLDTQPATSAEDTREDVADRLDIAMVILEEFRTTLGAPEMQQDDDFFDFGGHSLLATRIIGRLLDSHGLEVNFNDFFDAPSAEALAARISVTRTDCSPSPSPPQTVASSKAPLALAQTSLWKAYAAHDFGTIFNLPFGLEFLDAVDESLFEQAFRDVLKRHAGLRTLFYQQDGRTWQQAISISELADYRWFWTSRESQGITLQDEASHRFDLASELPLRVRFLRDSKTGNQVLSLLVHHMAIDEWSLNTVIDDLRHAYLARSSGSEPHWTRPAPPFHDFAHQQHAAGVDPGHLQYWKDRLAGANSQLQLFSGDKPEETETASLAADWIEQPLAQEISNRLYAIARHHNVSLFNVIYTAIALTLHSIGQSRDIVIGTSASGRTDPTFYETVGYFTTMVAHRISVTPEMPIARLLDNIQHQIGESMAYADVPIDLIQQALGMAEGDGLPFEAYVQIHAKNALNGSLATADGETIRYRQIDPDKSESMFDLQFEIMEDNIEGENHLRLVITYNADRYHKEQAEKLGATIRKTLSFFAEHELLNAPVSEVTL
ncbi:condensation domain-containing protein [Halomonas elongata]|uniref:condensation domain-containing protein n=1 Tax=Halomonas elongata TaxID=2746 RepID=UPI00186BAB1F|nr:condensation domain-containing protein [Halomonas elongata]MBW5801727.1 hypothetical protein [Halomonas elongata]